MIQYDDAGYIKHCGVDQIVLLRCFYLVCEAIGTAALPASGDSEDDCGEVDGM
jgi:hypothetical protein